MICLRFSNILLNFRDFVLAIFRQSFGLDQAQFYFRVVHDRNYYISERTVCSGRLALLYRSLICIHFRSSMLWRPKLFCSFFCGTVTERLLSGYWACSTMLRLFCSVPFWSAMRICCLPAVCMYMHFCLFSLIHLLMSYLLLLSWKANAKYGVHG